MPDPIEVDGFGTLNQGLVHDVVVLQEGGGGGGTFNEAALVSVAGSLSQTLKFNYERLNQIGHPNPSPWPHGAATVELPSVSMHMAFTVGAAIVARCS